MWGGKWTWLGEGGGAWSIRTPVRLAPLWRASCTRLCHHWERGRSDSRISTPHYRPIGWVARHETPTWSRPETTPTNEMRVLYVGSNRKAHKEMIGRKNCFQCFLNRIDQHLNLRDNSQYSSIYNQLQPQPLMHHQSIDLNLSIQISLDRLQLIEVR